MIYGWDHALVARRYERFCERHFRYSEANRHLADHAELAPGQRVLDIAAGTGRTAECALAAGAEVTCWEPAKAMRAVGRGRAPAASWPAELPAGRFDRVLCSAAAWQWQPFSAFVLLAAQRLRPSGALVFNVPALYLGVPDEPGGGRDPLLLELAGWLAAGTVPTASAQAPPLSESQIEADLVVHGFEPSQWRFEVRVTQACLVDWYRIPVLTDALFPAEDSAWRDARIDAAAQQVDPHSWKREGWIGWTAWKP